MSFRYCFNTRVFLILTKLPRCRIVSIMLTQLYQKVPGITHWLCVLLILALFTATAKAGQAVLYESRHQPDGVQSHYTGKNQPCGNCRSTGCDSPLKTVSTPKALSDCTCPNCQGSFDNILFAAAPSQNKAPLVVFVVLSELEKTSAQAPFDMQVQLDSPPSSPPAPLYTLHCRLLI